MFPSRRLFFRGGLTHRAGTDRWTPRLVGLFLWVGLFAALFVAPGWAADEQTAAPGGIPIGIPSSEMEAKDTGLTGLNNTPEGGTLPGGTVPGGTWPNVTPPGGTVPGGTVPGGTLPGGTFPEETVPGGTLPGGTVPGGTVASENLPGEDP